MRLIKMLGRLIEQDINRIIMKELENIMSGIADVKAAVDAESVLVKSVIDYLGGLPALIQQAQGADQAAIDTLVAQVQADTAALQAASAAAPKVEAPAVVAPAAPVDPAPAPADPAPVDAAPAA